MAREDAAGPPFDVFAMSEDVRQRFGWSNEDLNRVMEQLLPAALSGFQVFGVPQSGLADLFSGNMGAAGGAVNPFAAAASMFQPPAQQALAPFFGPEAVQQAVAAQISSLTGTSTDAVQELMPVAATLAFGQVARPFFHGEARNLLDAYMRGFARGRPKPQPTPVDYFQGYTEAMTAFWGAFLQAPGSQTSPEDADGGEPVEEPPEQPEAVQGQEPSEFDAMVSGWMAAGRDFQSSQFKAFDSFFEKAAKDVDE